MRKKRANILFFFEFAKPAYHFYIFCFTWLPEIAKNITNPVLKIKTDRQFPCSKN
jgi:hypothetical protein